MLNRRTVLAAAGVGGVALAGAWPALAQAPAPYEIDGALIDAAKKEGTVVWYTATDVQVSERVGKAFEEKYPGIKVQVERAGSERVFQRISQEYGSNIRRADVIETSDAVHFVLFSARAGSCRSCRATSPSSGRPRCAIPTASSPPTGPTCRSSPTTPPR